MIWVILLLSASNLDKLLERLLALSDTVRPNVALETLLIKSAPLTACAADKVSAGVASVSLRLPMLLLSVDRVAQDLVMAAAVSSKLTL